MIPCPDMQHPTDWLWAFLAMVPVLGLYLSRIRAWWHRKRHGDCAHAHVPKSRTWAAVVKAEVCDKGARCWGWARSWAYVVASAVALILLAVGALVVGTIALVALVVLTVIGVLSLLLPRRWRPWWVNSIMGGAPRDLVGIESMKAMEAGDGT